MAQQPPLKYTFNGEPGTRWTNDTDRARYQFIAKLQNTCGVCLQYHMAIGPHWPIQIHRGCRCMQIIVMPGQEAPHAFVDFRALLREMPHDQQDAAVGAANYRLLEAGVVKWEDIVMKTRARPLEEVVALLKLSVETMLRAGVEKSIAEQAYAAVHTPEQELVCQHRAELIAKLEKAGVSREELISELSRRITGRVTIVGGNAPKTKAAQTPPPDHGAAPEGPKPPEEPPASAAVPE